jgi:putative transposase
MARLPRLAVSGCVHHVLVRGNNGQNVFADDQDRREFIELLADSVRNWRVALHAFVLLPNQFQLLVTPQNEMGLPKLMQAIGRRYASQFNRRHSRTGTLWEGRYRSIIIEPERHFFEGMVWMDTQPVRAKLCSQARDYLWSSCSHYLGLQSMGFITPHARYWTLGNTPFAREAAYAALLDTGVGEQAAAQWQEHAFRGWVLGGAEFVDELQKLTPRRLLPGKPGRPPKGRTKTVQSTPTLLPTKETDHGHV